MENEAKTFDLIILIILIISEEMNMRGVVYPVMQVRTSLSKQRYKFKWYIESVNYTNICFFLSTHMFYKINCNLNTQKGSHKILESIEDRNRSIVLNSSNYQ